MVTFGLLVYVAIALFLFIAMHPRHPMDKPVRHWTLVLFPGRALWKVRRALLNWEDTHWCDLGQHYTLFRTHWVCDNFGVPVLDGCARCHPRPKPGQREHASCDRCSDIDGDYRAKDCEYFPLGDELVRLCQPCIDDERGFAKRRARLGPDEADEVTPVRYVGVTDLF